MPFTIVCDRSFHQPHIRLLRIRPNNLQLTIRHIFVSLANMSWIDSFLPEYLRQSLYARVEPTVRTIANHLNDGNLTAVDSHSGELVVSELARQGVVNRYGYLDIPIGEFIATQVAQNPGFDFYSVNLNDIILFGESKYVAARTAHNDALKQIVNFKRDQKDDKDLVTVHPFVPEGRRNAFVNYNNGQKGYIAAFAAKNESDDELITKIQANAYFQRLTDSSELICVAVDV